MSVTQEGYCVKYAGCKEVIQHHALTSKAEGSSGRLCRKPRKSSGGDRSPGHFAPTPSETLRTQPFTERRRNRPGAGNLGLIPQIREVGTERGWQDRTYSVPLKVRKSL